MIKLWATDKRDGVIDEATGKLLLNRYYTLRLVPQPKVENGQVYLELLITRDPVFD